MFFVFRQGAIKRKRIVKFISYTAFSFYARVAKSNALYPCIKGRFRLRSAERKTNNSVAFRQLRYGFGTYFAYKTTFVPTVKVIE